MLSGPKFYDRIHLLLRQHRPEEARELIKIELNKFPEDFNLRYLYAFTHYLTNELNESRRIAESLVEENPEALEVISLLANIDIADDLYNDAEAKARHLVAADPEESNYHILLGKIKYSQRYYDQSLKHLKKALELDPENKEALNLQSILAEQVGDQNLVRSTLEELLRLDPENPTSIANDGLRLLNSGKVRESLERFKDALQRQPSNQLARHGMQEALKSKFFLYRLFYQYARFTSRLSGKQSWIFIIGMYLIYRFSINISRNSEGSLHTLMTLIAILLGVSFFLTWVLNPLMNLYLLTNKYGILLLEEEEKTMAKYTGITLMIGLSLLVAYLVIGSEVLIMQGILFIALMIPAGTYLNPHGEAKQKKLRNFGIGLLVATILSFVLPQFFIVAVVGLFIYQFYYNGMMINDFSRKF